MGKAFTSSEISLDDRINHNPHLTGTRGPLPNTHKINKAMNHHEKLRALRLPTAAPGLHRARTRRGLGRARGTGGAPREGEPRGGAGPGGPRTRGGRAAGPPWASGSRAAASGQHRPAGPPPPPRALTGGQPAGAAAASSRAACGRFSFCSSMAAAAGTAAGTAARRGRESGEPAPGRSSGPATAAALLWLRETREAAAAAPGVPGWHQTLRWECATRARAASPPAVPPALGPAPLQQHCRLLRLPQPFWASAQRSVRDLGSRQLSGSSLRVRGNTH